jgi:hypothetical protein
VYFINGEAHKFYTNTRAITYDPEGNPISFTHIPIRFLTIDGEIIKFTAEVYIVDELRYNILLGTSFLKPSKIDIIWSKTDLDFDHLIHDGKKVQISCSPNKKTKK